MNKFNTEHYIAELKSDFRKAANEANQRPMEQYMKDQFSFYGIKATNRRKVSQKYMEKECRPPFEYLENVVKELWQLPQREFQYFGVELTEKYTTHFQQDSLSLIEFMITQKPWWDTVDHIAKKLAGAYLLKFPKAKNKTTEKWVNSGDLWLQRTALLFQLSFKEQTDNELLFTLINQLKAREDFFIQKAIGWALREYSKTAPDKVKVFVSAIQLSNLSKREAMKVIERK